jgi:hypothetical protein
MRTRKQPSMTRDADIGVRLILTAQRYSSRYIDLSGYFADMSL